MVTWNHQLNGHESEQTPGDSEVQGSLACCSPWGHKELDMTEQLNNCASNSNCKSFKEKVDPTLPVFAKQRAPVGAPRVSDSASCVPSVGAWCRGCSENEGSQPLVPLGPSGWGPVVTVR